MKQKKKEAKLIASECDLSGGKIENVGEMTNRPVDTRRQ